MERSDLIMMITIILNPSRWFCSPFTTWFKSNELIFLQLWLYEVPLCRALWKSTKNIYIVLLSVDPQWHGDMITDEQCRMKIFSFFFYIPLIIAVDALVSEDGDLVIDPSRDRKPVKWMEERCDVFVLLHSHRDPCSAVLDVLQSWRRLLGIQMKSALQ